MDFDEDHKNQMGAKLTRRLAQALKNGEITQEQLAVASGYILDNIDTLTTHAQFVEFLTNLSSQWPIFSDYLVVEKGRINEQVEKTKTDEVRTLIEDQAKQKIGGTA